MSTVLGRTIPVADGIPILGSALAMFSDTRAFLSAQYQKHGPVFEARAAHQRFVVLAGVDANLFASREGSKYLRSKEFWQPQNIEVGAQRSMISEDGPVHAQMRKMQSRAYGRSAAEGHYDQLAQIALDEVNTWQVGQEIPVMMAMKRIVTEQLGQLTTHFSPRPYLPDMLRFVRTLLTVTVTQQSPRIALLSPAYKRSKAKVFAMVQEVINQHQRPDHPPDLITDLLQAQKEHPELLPKGDLFMAALGPFIAGLDTAANALGFLMYVLHQHPEVLAQVRQEVQQATQQPLSAQTFKQMPLLHHSIMEALRLFPIAPALTRTATQDFEFAGFRIKAGSKVMVATTVPHYLPEIYPNPNAFDPSRFARGEHRKAGAYAPFGVGAHTCLGAGLAEVIIMLTTMTLLKSAHLEPLPTYRLRIVSQPTPGPDQGFKLRVAAKA